MPAPYRWPDESEEPCRPGWSTIPRRSTTGRCAGSTATCPSPGPGQVRVRVTCCGVCRTDLHLAEGDLPPRRPRSRRATRSSGVVDALGAGRTPVRRRRPGRRRRGSAGTDGTCRFCRRGQENLCLAPDVHRLGRRRRLRRRAAWSTRRYAYRLPDALDDEQPRRCCAPASSATGRCACRGAARRPARHLRLRRQRAPHRPDRAAPGAARARADPRRAQPRPGARARRRLGRRRGRRAARAARRRDPVRPGRRAGAGRAARARPRRHPGRRRHLAVRHPGAALRRPSCSEERRLRSVTANTRADGEEFLRAGAAGSASAPTTVAYPMADAPRALADLAHGRFSGAAVLHN